MNGIPSRGSLLCFRFQFRTHIGHFIRLEASQSFQHVYHPRDGPLSAHLTKYFFHAPDSSSLPVQTPHAWSSPRGSLYSLNEYHAYHHPTLLRSRLNCRVAKQAARYSPVAQSRERPSPPPSSVEPGPPAGDLSPSCPVQTLGREDESATSTSRNQTCQKPLTTRALDHALGSRPLSVDFPQRVVTVLPSHVKGEYPLDFQTPDFDDQFGRLKRSILNLGKNRPSPPVLFYPHLSQWARSHFGDQPFSVEEVYYQLVLSKKAGRATNSAIQIYATPLSLPDLLNEETWLLAIREALEYAWMHFYQLDSPNTFRLHLPGSTEKKWLDMAKAFLLSKSRIEKVLQILQQITQTYDAWLKSKKSDAFLQRPPLQDPLKRYSQCMALLWRDQSLSPFIWSLFIYAQCPEANLTSPFYQLVYKHLLKPLGLKPAPYSAQILLRQLGIAHVHSIELPLTCPEFEAGILSNAIRDSCVSPPVPIHLLHVLRSSASPLEQGPPVCVSPSEGDRRAPLPSVARPLFFCSKDFTMTLRHMLPNTIPVLWQFSSDTNLRVLQLFNFAKRQFPTLDGKLVPPSAPAPTGPPKLAPPPSPSSTKVDQTPRGCASLLGSSWENDGLFSSLDPDHHARADYSSMPSFAIDDQSTTEVDDAIAIDIQGLSPRIIAALQAETPSNAPIQDDIVPVYVHIADPTSIIHPDQFLDLSARQRVETLYYPHRKSHMMPVLLSEQICSLQPGSDVKNRCLTFVMHLHATTGELASYLVRPSILSNLKRANYFQIQKIIETQNSTHTSPTHPDEATGSTKTLPLPDPDVSAFSQSDMAAIRTLYLIAKRRRQWRIQQGASQFTLSQVSVSVSLGGKISLDTHQKYQTFSRLLVEEMMILVGETCGRLAHSQNIPVPYRTQPHKHLLSPDTSTPFNLSPPQSELVLTLRQLFFLHPASTSVRAQPHVSVGLPQYVRATSPLRRYSDMLVHHQLKAWYRQTDRPFSHSYLDAIVSNLDQLTRRIKASQRKVLGWWKVQWMAQQPHQNSWKAIVFDVNRDTNPPATQMPPPSDTGPNQTTGKEASFAHHLQELKQNCSCPGQILAIFIEDVDLICHVKAPNFSPDYHVGQSISVKPAFDHYDNVHWHIVPERP